MKRLVAIVGLSVLAWSAAQADPLAEARAGQLQCYKPDTARKTCAARSGYAFGSDGQIINTADVLLAPQPALIMRTSSSVVIKGEAVCGPMRKEDIETAQLLLNGAPLPEDKAAAVRAQIIGAFQQQIGKEVCTTYVPAGDRLSAQVSIDGVPNPAYTQEVIWVKPEDGYAVSP